MSERPKEWVDFMMRFELGLETPDPKRARNSATVIAMSYLVGGLVPLAPYMFLNVAQDALIPSIIVTLIALAVFGYVKGRYTGAGRWKSALQTTIVGGLAAAAAYRDRESDYVAFAESRKRDTVRLRDSAEPFP